jgi:hypothetical protein
MASGTRADFLEFAMSADMARIAEWENIADCIASTLSERFDVMQIQLPATMAAGAPMTVALQFGLPLCGAKRTCATFTSASRCCVLSLVDAAVRSALPFATNALSTFGILFCPSLRATLYGLLILLVPRALIVLRLGAMLAIVATLIGAVLFAVLGAPLAASSAGAFLVFAVVFAPLALKFGGVFPVGSFRRHAGKCTTTTRKGFLFPWTHKRTISLNGSFLATSLIAWFRRAQCKILTNFRFYLTRINTMVRAKFSLIDLDGETPNKAEGESHGERLSERTREKRDATVWTHGNRNHERAAEMAVPAL